MKRSEINRLIKKSKAFFAKNNFLLPPFAEWTAGDWKSRGLECAEIVNCHLGWDLTDFGSGDFNKMGLMLFTIRNGSIDPKNSVGKSYAEKIMIVEEEQVTPTHFHFLKMEDIINRGGGTLLVQLWNSGEGKELLDTDVIVSKDGVRVNLKAGGILELKPGESVCLQQKLYHKFWGKKGAGTVLVGEVSRVNDDYTDNYFYEPAGRFPEIMEDETPLHLLCNDYKDYYPHYTAVVKH